MICVHTREKCRQKMVVHEVKCKLCNYVYVGNTQQTFKDRIQGRYCDVKKLVSTGEKSDPLQLTLQPI